MRNLSRGVCEFVIQGKLVSTSYVQDCSKYNRFLSDILKIQNIYHSCVKYGPKSAYFKPAIYPYSIPKIKTCIPRPLPALSNDVI